MKAKTEHEVGKGFSDDIPPTKVTYVEGRPVSLRLRRCKLIILGEGGRVERERVFEQNVIRIGAMDDNDVSLRDETVSRYHCRIVEEEDRYLIADLGSTNGTWVDRVRIKEAYLRPGCTVRLGKSELRFLAEDEEVEIRPLPGDRFCGLVGRDTKMRQIFGILERIGPTGVTAIIEGETGTGKELVARAIHQSSQRKEGPFMVIDCGAVPPTLIESELFGHEKGSFTGAIMTRKGLFELANGGTVFLDEIGELPLDLQPKLLRVLEAREVKRVGATHSLNIDVRVIAATNRNLEEEVAKGRFREDLFYRLSVVRVVLPPLRDRSGDIPLLVKHFLKSHPSNRGRDGQPRVTKVERDVLESLQGYLWPGNVREMCNAIERAISFSENGVIRKEDLPPHVLGMESSVRSPKRPSTSPSALDHPLEQVPFKEAKEKWVASFEKDYLMALLKKHNMNISQAAREAELDRKYLRRLIRKYNIKAVDTDD